MSHETETSPVTEALLQLNNIYQLLDKRQEYSLVARMKVESNAHKHNSWLETPSQCFVWTAPYFSHQHQIVCVSPVCYSVH